jgi:uncharacterized protein YbjT (DUF2867 family)
VSKGIQVVKAHANNKSELLAAFKDSYAVFAVTNFWDPEILAKDPKIEVSQGKLIADSAIECGVKHYLWSSLPPAAKISKGKYSHVQHFDNKAEVEDYVRSKNINATFVHAGFYMTNFQSFMPPSQDKNGNVVFSYSCGLNMPMPLIDIQSDFGRVVHAILKAGPEATKNESVFVSSGYLTLQDVLDTFTRVTGRKAIYNKLERSQYKAGLASVLGESAAEDFIQMLEYFEEFGYFGGAELKTVRKYLPEMTSYEQFLKKSGWKGPQ